MSVCRVYYWHSFVIVLKGGGKKRYLCVGMRFMSTADKVCLVSASIPAHINSQYTDETGNRTGGAHDFSRVNSSIRFMASI